MRKDIRPAVTAVVLMTVLLGLLYPLAVTGIGAVVFPNRAHGSQVTVGGKVVGSKLIGQDFQRPVIGAGGKAKVDADGNPVLTPDRRYFQSRPSATGYAANATAFSNLGPNSAELRDRLKASAVAYLALERPFNPGLTLGDVPGDAVFTSGSNVDPMISTDNARIQAGRVAAVRRLPKARVLELVGDATDGRFAGVLGTPGVNVLELNLAIDREAAR